MTLRSRFGGTACAGLVLVVVLGGFTTVKAATIVKDFTVNGTSVQNDSGFFGITSGAFADFNTALGTLTGVTVSFSGTANYNEPNSAGDTASFADVTTASDVHEQIVSGNGFGIGGDFSVSANGTDDLAVDLAMFEGSGTQALVFDFAVDAGTVSMTNQSGTVTYTYTPAAPVSSLPETGSLTLFATALAGLLALARPGVRRQKAQRA